MADVQQLPRGSHRLTREEVLSSQRGRMLAAMGEAVAERGYVRTPVAEVLRRAGVSRETFYEQFTGKEDCFLTALEVGTEAMIGEITPAVADPDMRPGERFERMLAAYLAALAAEPAFARTFLIEAYAAGPTAIERRVATQARFAGLVTAMAGAESAEDRFACEMIVSAISSMVTMHVASGRAAELPKLRAPIMRFVRGTPVGRLL
jgi:AcrR family transcriptional regulator